MPFMETPDPREGGELSPFEAAKARVGTALNAKWHLDALLGVGGMGSVFAATHRNGSRAAVKVLHIEFARESDIRERFLREGKIANRVDHPARVAVSDDDVSDAGEPFLVMELLEGSTLERVIKRAGGKLPVDDALRIFDIVLDLLIRCHKEQIVHRDIKPANVFITKAGEVKVLDFGVARMRDPGTEATRAGTALGTPSFMAPEQALGLDAADGRADLWSVGACLFTSLTGVRLHKGQTETESFILAATQAAPSIASVAPELPVELVAFIDKALVFDRTRRFQDAATMRAEMAALRSALVMGTLTSATQKKASGVVVRGNEAIEEGDSQASDEARAQAYERMQAIWKDLGVAFMGVRQYGWNHPTPTRSLQLAYEGIARALAQDPHAVRWDVTVSAFTYEDRVLWQPDRAPLDQIPYQLFRDGIRRVQLKQGILETELRDFAAILMHDLSSGASAEDDSVTALWDRRFEHIAYLAIDSFAEGDASEQEAFQSECEVLAGKALQHSHIDADWEEGTLEGRAMEMNLAVTLREVGEAAADLAVDPLTRATLGAQIALAAEKWRERYVDAFVDAYLDCTQTGDTSLLTDALREWANDQVTLHNHTIVFELQAALIRSFSTRLGEAQARALEPAIAAVMFPAETLRPILGELTRSGRDADQALAAPQAVLEGVARAIELLPDDTLFTDACACAESAGLERLREAALAYVQRWSRGHEPELAAMLPVSGAVLAVRIVRLLASMKTAEAAAALEMAFKSPHIRVRIEALAHMPDLPAERVREELQKLLSDPAPAVRMEALRMVTNMNVVAAGPALVRQIQAEEFHALPLTERQEWFVAVFQLNRARAEALGVELLSKRQYLIVSEPIEQTRALAAKMLGGASSAEALEALKGAAKRWGNSQAVRDAAARAAAAIEARLSGQGDKARPAPTGAGKS